MVLKVKKKSSSHTAFYPNKWNSIQSFNFKMSTQRNILKHVTVLSKAHLFLVQMLYFDF